MQSLRLQNPAKRYPLGSAIALLVTVIYAPLLLYWVDGWLNRSIGIDHEYYSYALLGFPYAAMAAWQLRQRWQALPDQIGILGFGLLGLAGFFFVSPVQNLINLSLPLGLSALVLIFKGLAGFRLMAFPLLFVALATPTDLPYLFAPYLLPLQTFIANVAGFILMQAGMNVTVDQIYILVNERIVEVAPYCAGLKMLVTSLYTALMLLHWTGNIRSRFKTITLLTGAALISVIGNILRNTLLTFFHGTDQTSWFSWLHDSWGGDVFSALLLFAVVLLMNGIERADDALSQSAVRGNPDRPMTF